MKLISEFFNVDKKYTVFQNTQEEMVKVEKSRHKALSSSTAMEPTTFELDVQRANPLRHEGYAQFVTSIKANDNKIISLVSKNNLQIFFEIHI